MKRHSRFLRRILAGLAFALIVVPAASAYRAEGVVWSGPSSVEKHALIRSTGVYPDAMERYLNNVSRPVSVSPDDRRGARLSAISQQASQLAPDDRRGPRLSAIVSTPLPVRATHVRATDGFDWADYGTGAGTAFVLCLCLGAAIVGLRRSGRTELAA